MVRTMGFKQAKADVLDALLNGRYQHETRKGAIDKNLLQTGAMSPVELSAVIGRCRGQHHSMSTHHQIPAITVHVLKRDEWYIKFYFIDPDTYFISVHQTEPEP
jgi:hypothetical protein